MAPARRTASDALKGATVPAEETQPELPATDAKEAEAEQAAAAEAAEAKTAEEAAKVDETAKDTEPDAEPVADESDEDDEDALVEAVVKSDMFLYFDESEAHCSALKGATIHVDRATAERGVKLNALTVKD